MKVSPSRRLGTGVYLGCVSYGVRASQSETTGDRLLLGAYRKVTTQNRMVTSPDDVTAVMSTAVVSRSRAHEFVICENDDDDDYYYYYYYYY